MLAMRVERIDPGLGIEANEELVGEGDTDDFGRFSSSGETLTEGDEVRFVTANNARSHEEEFPYGSPSTAHRTFSLMLAAVVGQL